MVVVALAGMCLLDLRDGAVLSSYITRDAAAGAWRRGRFGRKWRDDGIMSVAKRGFAGAVCPCAILARRCIFLIVLLSELRLVVGLGWRGVAAALALGVCGRRGHRRRVSGFHGRRTVVCALRLDEHQWLVTTNFERYESGRAEHDIAKPSGEDKNPRYMRFAWVNLGLGVAWPKTLAWSGHAPVIGETRVKFGSSPVDAEADKTEERPQFISFCGGGDTPFNTTLQCFDTAVSGGAGHDP